MPFQDKPRVFKSSIGTVCFGVGESAVTIGGQNSLPLQFFDAEPAHAPAVGAEITDLGFDASGLPILSSFYEGAETVAERVRRACATKGADFVCLRFEGADPGGRNRPVDECVALAREAADAATKPLCIAGCRNVDKDAEMFTAMAEALQGKNVLFLSAREENYKTVSAGTALAYGHKVGAESAVDINLAKQLNVLMTQFGVRKDSLVMNLGCSAAGYGFEYVSSTMDRVKAAALEQDDAMLQMPVVALVSVEAWSVKEALVGEEDMPAWGDLEQRGIQMETVTAAACLASGAEAVILRHPVSIEKIAGLVGALL